MFVAALLICGSAHADEPVEHRLPLIEQESGAFYLRGTLGKDIESEMLVDTGSSYVALSKATFDKLRKQERLEVRRTIHGTTANGRMIKVKVFALEGLKLSDDCVLNGVEAVVLPGANRDILGLTALRRLQPFSMTFEPATLSFESCLSNPAKTELLAAAPD